MGTTSTPDGNPSAGSATDASAPSPEASSGSEVSTSLGAPAAQSGKATRGSIDPSTPKSTLAGGDCAKGSHAASDRGVTPTTLKLGFFIPSTDYANQMGFGINGGDARKAIQAMVDQVNDFGGVCGRKLTWAAVDFNPFDDSDKRAACIKMTQEEKVFATIDNLTFGVAGNACLVENKTPFISFQSLEQDVLRSLVPYGWIMRFTRNRLIRNWVLFIKSHGMANASTKLGILSTTYGPDQRLTVLLKNELKNAGLTVAAEFTSSDDYTTGPVQMADAAVQFKARGVQVVLPVTSFIHLTAFMNNAKGQQYRPVYTVWHDLTLDFTTAGYPADQFEGSMGPTDTITGQDKAEIPPQWAQQYCFDTYIKRTGDTSAAGATNGLFYCQAVELFGEALRRTGANPTRDGWIKAMGTIADFQRTAVTPPLAFSPSRHDGGVSLATVKWYTNYKDKTGCKCFVQIELPRRAQY